MVVLKQLEKEKAWKVGLLQALGVAIYCGLVATFMTNFEHLIPNQPGIVAGFLMLSLLVFSAAVSGSLVFAYPVYLAFMKQRVVDAAKILIFTMIFSSVIILGTIVYLFTVFPQL